MSNRVAIARSVGSAGTHRYRHRRDMRQGTRIGEVTQVFRNVGPSPPGHCPGWGVHLDAHSSSVATCAFAYRISASNTDTRDR
jgi:hypothetical protein